MLVVPCLQGVVLPPLVQNQLQVESASRVYLLPEQSQTLTLATQYPGRKCFTGAPLEWGSLVTDLATQYPGRKRFTVAAAAFASALAFLATQNPGEKRFTGIIVYLGIIPLRLATQNPGEKRFTAAPAPADLGNCTLQPRTQVKSALRGQTRLGLPSEGYLATQNPGEKRFTEHPCAVVQLRRSLATQNPGEKRFTGVMPWQSVMQPSRLQPRTQVKSALRFSSRPSYCYLKGFLATQNPGEKRFTVMDSRPWFRNGYLQPRTQVKSALR